MISLLPDLEHLTGDEQAWFLTFASSAACVLGCLVLYVDSIIFAFKRLKGWITGEPPGEAEDLWNSKGFLIISLSLSGGILIFTALYRLFPQALVYLEHSKLLTPQQSNFLVLVMFISGVIVCAGINYVVHAATSKSIVHCVHGDERKNSTAASSHTNTDDTHTEEHHHDHAHNHPHTHVNTRPRTHSHVHGGHHHVHVTHETHTHVVPGEMSENTPLLQTAPRKRSILDLAHETIKGEAPAGECRGYTCGDCCAPEEQICDPDPFEEPFAYPGEEFRFQDDHGHAEESVDPLEEHDHEEDTDLEHQVHHHHVSTRRSHLYSIALQTGLAITLHKLPEGFITFATSHADKELGLNVFLSLVVHNFTEGFTIAFPFYASLRKKWQAVLLASVLGGCSQPLGAVVAWLMFRHQNLHTDATDILYGSIMGMTCGFLCVIGLQMYGTAIGFGGTQKVCLTSAFGGMFIVGCCYALTA
ncbi:Zinc-regulated transporter 3 [Yarrowia sp. B02]|nr:Zinc-regulated transporter 3 [Yarrowia sp. B02]